MTHGHFSRRRLLVRGFVAALGGFFQGIRTVRAPTGDHFRVTVTDTQTGCGIPLVKLETVNSERFYTDSSGIAAIGEPGLMGQMVWFTVRTAGRGKIGTPPAAAPRHRPRGVPC